MPPKFLWGGGTRLTDKSVASQTTESEGTEMAKTTDRIVIDDEEYMVQDTDAKSAIGIFNPTLFPSYYPRKTTLHSGYGIKSDTGVPGSSSVLYYSDRFKVVPGTTIRLRNAFPGTTSGGWGIAFYTNLLNATFSYISGVSYENGSDIDVVVPDTAHYCAITVHKNNIDIYRFGYEIENNLENVIALANETAYKTDCFKVGRNLFDKTTVTENKWISGADGSLQSNNSYDTSDYIPITPGKAYTVSEKFSWAIFNASKVYSRNGGTPTTFIAQSGDAFIRFSFIKANIDSVMFEENGFTGIYQPFDYRIDRSALMFDDVSTEPKNLFNPNVSVSGYLGTNGTIQISSDYKTSQFIKVEAGQYYTCYGLFGSVHLYAADGTHSRGVSSIRYNGRNAVTFVPAEGETLVRLSYYKNDENIISIEKNIGLSSMTKNVADVVKPDRMDADSYKKTIVFVGSACYFTTISGALAAITDATEKNRYEIYIYPGTYEETFTTKDWVDIVGQNKYQCVINYTSDDESDYENRSTIFAATNTRIANLTITTTGSKYPIHIDANYGKTYDLTVENCIVIHNGFTSVSAAGTGIGIGLHFGQNVLIKDCAVSGENAFGTASIYCHNDNENASQAYSAYHRQLKVENCLLTQSYYGIRVGCVESYDGQDNSVILIGNVNKCTVPYYYTPGSYDSWHFFAVNNTPEYE